MIRFQRPELPPPEAILAYFARSQQARWFTNGGPCHELLVDRLQERLGLHCVPVANGTLALMVALRGLVGLRPEAAEVVLPSFTFAATAEAVIWAGLTPVFVDVEPAGWHLSREALSGALRDRGPRVAAILACSTFGTAPSLTQRRAWESAAADHDVPLLVDSAAGFGTVDEAGHPLGEQGDAEIFSFHATKPFAIGEGGLITTGDSDLAARVARLTNFGFENQIVVGDLGLNAKLSEWACATALALLDDFPQIVNARRVTAATMREGLDKAAFTSQEGGEHSALQFLPVLAATPTIRDRALDASRRASIEMRSYFSEPLHRMPAFANCPQHGDLSCTVDLASRILSLPMSNDLPAAAVDRIVAVLNDAAS